MSEENKECTKKEYTKPTIESEKLNTYGAVCNGTTKGGRKASSSAPSFCKSSRLNS